MTRPDPHIGQQPQRAVIPTCRACRRILTPHNRHCPTSSRCPWCAGCVDIANRENPLTA